MIHDLKNYSTKYQHESRRGSRVVAIVAMAAFAVFSAWAMWVAAN